MSAVRALVTSATEDERKLEKERLLISHAETAAVIDDLVEQKCSELQVWNFFMLVQMYHTARRNASNHSMKPHRALLHAASVCRKREMTSACASSFCNASVMS